MPYRDRAQVERWLAEFQGTPPTIEEPITALDRDYARGPDSGMIVVSLSCSPAVVYLSVTIADGAPRWRVTFDGRDDYLNLPAISVAKLAQELDTLARLCEHLQARTDETLGTVIA